MPDFTKATVTILRHPVARSSVTAKDVISEQTYDLKSLSWEQLGTAIKRQRFASKYIAAEIRVILHPEE